MLYNTIDFKVTINLERIFQKEFTKKILKYGANSVFISQRKKNVHFKSNIEVDKFNVTQCSIAEFISYTESTTPNLNLDIISEQGNS